MWMLVGCLLNPNASFTGTVVVGASNLYLTSNNTDFHAQTRNGQNNTECNGNINDNAGCAIIELSRASYGPFFDSQGGGVFVMKWDENGIAVCPFLFFM